ncbi:hypothetical protein [Acidicapsa acidisoli]|uniref:hypothetical protein n=1 Tax=Acidicapsa acidisoli TaxID=1615681 RepID=UPI0021E04292|nr:hypothetical protein [Acidicapsa acidisoli]
MTRVVRVVLSVFRCWKPLGWCIFAAAACALTAKAQMTTSQYDNARTGAYLSERTLTPRNVNPRQFGKLFTMKVDGDVYAQPLFLAGVPIPGKGTHDVVFIATEHDSVYAFDAYGNPSAPLWHVSLLRDDATTVPAGDVSCPFIVPEVGITSTPVIDAKTGTLYVLARTKIGHLLTHNEYHQQLHALAVTSGVEKFGGQVEIQAAVRGRGAGGLFGTVAFEPLRENPRAALLLVNGLVYLSWASSCDVGPYHGWVMAYDAQSLKQRAAYNTSPDTRDSGIWASDTGPAADSDGNVFVATGNGRFDVAKGGRDFGDVLLKLHFYGQSLQPIDYFAPFNVEELEASDGDLGSGGPILLPDQPGPHAHLAIIGGKGEMLYILDRDHLGEYHAENNDHAVQTVPTQGGIFGSMAYWNHHVYVLSDGDSLRDYEVKSGKLSFSTSSSFRFEDHAATPAISANGATDGIVWVASSKGWSSPDRPAVLHACDASNIAHELYNSNQNPARDKAGKALRFNIPTIVNGHVYLGAKGEVDVYGLLPVGR